MNDISGIKGEVNLSPKLAFSFGGKSAKTEYKNCNFSSANRVSPYLSANAVDLVKEYLCEQKFFSRDDNYEDVLNMIFPPKNYERIIDKISPYISEKDKGHLLAAASLCVKENKGMDTEEDIKKLIEAKHFTKRARTIYNWLRSEDVFPQDIYPIIATRGGMNISAEDFRDKIFPKFWDEMISKHLWRIFVPRGSTRESLIAEITERIYLHKRESVYVYSRDNVNKLSKSVVYECKGYDGPHHLNVSVKKYDIGNHPALRFKIKREVKKDKKYLKFKRKKKKSIEKNNSKLHERNYTH